MTQQGFYRDPPNRRMAYDDDGCIVVEVANNGSITQYTTNEMQVLNSEAHTTTDTVSGLGTVGPYYTIIFPELRDVSHAYRNLNSGTYAVQSYSSSYQVSSNTTNGQDGDWTNAAPIVAYVEATNPAFRGTNLLTVGSSNSKAIRHHGGTAGTYSEYHWCQWHIYGVKSAGQTPHRIDFTDSSGNELLIDNDFGDQARNAERIWSPSNTYNQSSALYLKNRSNTKQATDVNITYEVLTGDFNNFLTLSKDNITFGTTVNYATINPLQVVGPIYVKHAPTITATLGVKAARLQVTVGTWL